METVTIIFNCTHGSIKIATRPMSMKNPVAVDMAYVGEAPFCLECLEPMKITGYERNENN